MLAHALLAEHIGLMFLASEIRHRDMVLLVLYRLNMSITISA